MVYRINRGEGEEKRRKRRRRRGGGEKAEIWRKGRGEREDDEERSIYSSTNRKKDLENPQRNSANREKESIS